MKMTKKSIFAALAVAAVIGFASCQQEIGDINWKSAAGSGDGTTTFKVNQKNDQPEYLDEAKTKPGNTIRGIKQVGALDRAKGTCVVRQYDQTNASRDGMVGFITYFTKNDQVAETAENYGTYNFLVVGVQNVSGVTWTYASYYCNIKKDALSTQNFGAYTQQANGALKNTVKPYFDEKETKPYEIEILTYPTVLSGVSFDKDKTLTVGIQFEQKDNGDVDITWWKNLKEDTQSATTSGGEKLASITANNKITGRTAASPKGKICAYANIYASKTLNARWDFYDISWKRGSLISSLNAEDDDFIEAGDILFE